MDAHVQVLPRLRVHMILDDDPVRAYGVVQEVVAIPGGLLRLYRHRDGTGAIVSNLALDPRVEFVAEQLTLRARAGVVRLARG